MVRSKQYFRLGHWMSQIDHASVNGIYFGDFGVAWYLEDARKMAATAAVVCFENQGSFIDTNPQ